MCTRKKIRVGAFVFLALFACVIVYARSQHVVPILMYHSVRPGAEKNNRIVVSPQTFERQMAFLAKYHYRVVPLSEVIDAVGGHKRLPERTVVITFDDGYTDNYTYAFPILRKYNFPASIFVVYEEVGTEGKLNWDEIKSMQASGLISFGSHSMSHPYLVELTDERDIQKELAGSKQALEAALQSPVSVFCYPSGRFNDQIKHKVKQAGYVCALATHPRQKVANDDLFALKRIRISESAANMFIFFVETSGYYNILRDLRHR